MRRSNMDCSLSEFMQYVNEEDIKFIRLAFCDVHGNRKNISIMPHMLEEAVKNGIPINASLIPGFGENVYPDLFLHPDISTTTLLPWRPENGKVIRMLLRRASISISDQELSSIFSRLMKREIPQKHPSITQVTWTLRPSTSART